MMCRCARKHQFIIITISLFHPVCIIEPITPPRNITPPPPPPTRTTRCTRGVTTRWASAAWVTPPHRCGGRGGCSVWTEWPSNRCQPARVTAAPGPRRPGTGQSVVEWWHERENECFERVNSIRESSGSFYSYSRLRKRLVPAVYMNYTSQYIDSSRHELRHQHESIYWVSDRLS